MLKNTKESASMVTQVTKDETQLPPSPEVVLAIAMALEMKRKSEEDLQAITWERYPTRDSVWAVSGRLENLNLHRLPVRMGR